MPKAITPAPEQLHISGATRQQKLYDSAIELLRLAEPPEGYYLATSFGKDSIVVHRLCDEAGVRYDAHHNLTGIDPPELVRFGLKHYPDVHRQMYPASMWQLIVTNGMLPMRQRRYCCAVLKEDGGLGRRCVMGIRAEESDRRKRSWAPVATRSGTPGGELRIFDNDDVTSAIQTCSIRGKMVINPLYHWTWDDLWSLIRDRKLPYCCLYDEGFDRLGCIGCPMAKEVGRRRDFARWPKYHGMYVRAVQRAIDRGKFAKLAHLGAAGIVERWVSDEVQDKPMEGQIQMEALL